MKNLLASVCLLFAMAVLLPFNEAAAQQGFTQTVRGKLTDEHTRQPLAGATVAVLTPGVNRGAISDDEGYFQVDSVPVGRATLVVQYLGYETRSLNNIVVATGKETWLEVALTEDFSNTTDVVEVTATQDPAATTNEFAVVGTRSFTIDEANRYAGTVGDPARMAANFAGVNNAGDTRNDLVIRGNSPLGMLWRFEGVDIPNPNHFGANGANGGPISILNNNTLANSDFSTGAWVPEYGNATSGVFDLNLRTGNPEKLEGLFQLGFNGLELLAEGPLSKKSNSSFLISYRYSSLVVFDALGISFGDLLGVPNFTDGTFNINLDLKKAGQLRLFGMGGYSSIEIEESKLDAEAWDELENAAYQDLYPKAGMGVGGLSWRLPLDDKSYLKTTLAYSQEYRSIRIDTVSAEQLTLPNYAEAFRQHLLQAHVQYTRKFNPRNTLRVGLQAKHFITRQEDSLSVAQFPDSVLFTLPLRNIDDNTQLLQAYAQHQWRITRGLSLTGGVHGLFFALNNTAVADPRLSLSWQLAPRHRVFAGSGLHHQLQNFTLYGTQNPANPEQRPNEDLKPTRSLHAVVGYEVSPAKSLRIKLEGYVQWLDQVPVDSFPSSFSAMNLGANFERIPDRTGFVSEGTAQNLGVELTVERFFTKNYYVLATASLFDSKYTASDGREYNTAFNANYVANLLAGVEFPVGKRKNTQLFGDVKLVTSGGARITPIDLEASQAAGTQVDREDEAFSERLRPFFRLDVKLGVRQNFRRWSHEFSFQVQNVTNYPNVFSQVYDPRSNQLAYRNQLGFFPVPQYRVLF